MHTEPHLQPPDIVKQMGSGQGESLAAYVSLSINSIIGYNDDWKQ